MLYLLVICLCFYPKSRISNITIGKIKIFRLKSRTFTPDLKIKLIPVTFNHLSTTSYIVMFADKSAVFYNN